MTLVTKKFASQITGLRLLDQNFTGLRATGEPVSVDLFDGGRLSIGSFTDPASIISVIDADLGPADGLISMSSFKNQVFTIDYDHKQLIFEDRKTMAVIRKTGKVIPLQLEVSRDKSLDIFAYFVNDQKLTLQFLMDSGAGDNVYRINARYMPQLQIDTAAASKKSHKSEFNPNVITHNYISSVRSIALKQAPEISLNNLKVNFIEGMIYDGVVSLNWIGKRITFDLKAAEVIVQKLR